MTPAESPGGSVHPTVLDALRDNPVAPLLGLPVEQVLAGMGLPGLPQPVALPPLPGLPALPPLDPVALAKPITDLFSGFGDGNLNNGGTLNPQVLLQNVLRAVETAMQWAAQGIQLLQTMQSAGAVAAAGTGALTQVASAAISTQGAQIHLTLGAAASTVAVGYARLASVAARFALTAAGLGPTLVTPPGQAALLASAVEAGSEAVAITAQTKAELAAHQAQMDEAGTRVQTAHLPSSRALRATAQPVTASLGGVEPGPASAATGSHTVPELARLLSELWQVVQPLASVAQQLGHDASAAFPTHAGLGGLPLPPMVPVHAGVSGTAATTGSGGAPTGPAAAPLGRWQAGNIVESVPGPVELVTAPTAITIVADETMSPMVPAAGPIGDGRLRSTAYTSALPVDVRYGDELVGSGLDDTTAPVIGGAVTGDPETPLHP
ncbi:hypothetical protein [Nocardia sp. NPDC005366]|uniref:hypothetical protein n=1 Tax=Nocardia sp. NPDC005366 TaxID=3156878 RepID=UPI0033B5E566